MNALIVGGTSSVATHLKPLMQKYATVITTGRKACDVRFDLTGPIPYDLLPSNVEIVVHAAASFAGESQQDIIETVHTNVLGTLKVCQLAHERNAKLMVLISSVFSCLDPCSPFASIYSLSKKQSEEVAQWYCCSHSLPLLIIRPSQIYGVGPVFEKHQPFFYLMIRRVLAGKHVVIYGSRDPKRNYIHVKDVAVAIDKAIRNRLEGVFSCASPVATTYGQIAETAFRITGSDRKANFDPSKPDILDNACVIDTKLYRKLSWSPSVSLEKGIAEIVSSMRDSTFGEASL